MTMNDKFPTQMLEYCGANRLYERDVWRAGPLRRPADQACDLDHDVHREDFLRSALKRELFDRFGHDTERCLAFHSAVGGGTLVVAVHRAGGEPAFDSECAAGMQALVALLKRMFDLRERIGAPGSASGRDRRHGPSGPGLGKTNSRRTPGALSRLSRLSAIARRGQLSTEP